MEGDAVLRQLAETIESLRKSPTNGALLLDTADELLTVVTTQQDLIRQLRNDVEGLKSLTARYS